MAFNFHWDKPPEHTVVFVKVGNETRKYRSGTGDFNEARQEVIRALSGGFRQHGAVLALIK